MLPTKSLWFAPFLLLVACASPPPPPAAPPPAAPVASAPAGPRCPRDAPNQPGNARAKMTGAGDEVKRCFLVGAAKANDSVRKVSVDLAISEAGEPRDIKLNAGQADPTSVSCARKAIEGVRFEKFCGDDVVISWSYTLQ